MADGIITKDDLITEDALQFGIEYQNNVMLAIQSNEDLKDSAKEMFAVLEALKKVVSDEDYKNAKDAEALATDKATEALKKRETAAISANKIRQEELKTEKLLLDVAAKKAKAVKTLSDLEVKQNELNEKANKATKEKVAIEQQLTDIQAKKQTLRSQGIQDSNQEITNLHKEEAALVRKLLLINQESSAIKIESDAIRDKLAIQKEMDAVEKQYNTTKAKRVALSTEQGQALATEKKALASERKELNANLTAMGRLTLKRNQALKAVQDYQAKVVLGEKISNTEQKEILESVAAFEKYDKAVKVIKESTNQFQESVGKYPQQIQATISGFKQLIPVLGVAGAIRTTFQTIGDSFDTIRTFDRQLIAVGKTTDISGDALKDFGREIVDLGDDLDGISIEGLSSSAEVAGQLGVEGTDNILTFSESIEKLKLTSDIVSDDQVQNFAKFIEVSQDSFENADRLASSMTVLGNNMATTESQVLKNSTEIQKGLSIYNASADSVLGLGAATSALGNEAEASRSAIQQTFKILDGAVSTGTKLEQVLRITGLTQKELSDQFKEDSTKTFVALVKGLGEMKDEGENLNTVLDDLGITNIRSTTVIGSLAANYDKLTQAVELSSQEYVDNLALTAEADAATQSIDSTLGDINDRWAAYVLRASDANGISEKIVSVLQYVRDNLEVIIDKFIKYGSVLLTYVGVMKLVNLSVTTFTALKAAATAAELKFALATGIGRKSVLAQAAAVRAAAVAQTGLNVAMLATPWGLILGLLAAVVVAYKIFNEELSENEILQKRVASATKAAAEREKNSAEASNKYYSTRLKQIEDEFVLKRAQQGASEALDQEEIESKRKLINTLIETNDDQIRANKDLLEDNKKTSEANIAALQDEVRAKEQAAVQIASTGSEFGVSSKTSEANNSKAKIAKQKADYAVQEANLGEFNKRLLDENRSYIKDLAKLDQDATVKRAEENKKREDEDAKSRARRLKAAEAFRKLLLSDKYNLKKAQLKSDIASEKLIVDNENESIGKRLLANKNFVDESVKLLEFERDYAISNAAGRLDEIERLNLLFNDSYNKLIREREDNAREILKDGFEDAKKVIEDRNALYESQENAKIQVEQTNLQEDLETIQGPADKLRRIEEFENEVTRIRREAATQRLNDQVSVIEEELNNPLLNPEDRILLEQMLAEAKIAASDAATDNAIENAEKEAEAMKALADFKAEKIAEASDVIAENLGLDAENLDRFINGIVDGFDSALEGIQAAFAVVGDVVSTIYDSNIDQIDEQISASEDYYAKQYELAAGDSEQQALLLLEGEARREALEKKKQKEQEKQAKAQKLFSIFEIGTNTAVAIMKSYAQLGPIAGSVAAALVGILGAAQIAAVAAKPIPKYRYGTKPKGHEGGYAEVAEVKPEIIHEPGKDPYLQKTRATLNLAKGTHVYSQENPDHAHMFREYQVGLVMAQFERQRVGLRNFETSTTEIYLDNSDVVKELKLTRQLLRRSEARKSKPVDFPHEVFRNNNIKWR